MRHLLGRLLDPDLGGDGSGQRSPRCLRFARPGHGSPNAAAVVRTVDWRRRDSRESGRDSRESSRRPDDGFGPTLRLGGRHGTGRLGLRAALPTASISHLGPAMLPKADSATATTTSGSALTGEPGALYDCEAAAHTEPGRPQRRPPHNA